MLMNYDNFQQNFYQGEYQPDPIKEQKREIRKAVLGIAATVIGIFILEAVLILFYALLKIILGFDVIDPLHKQILNIVNYVFCMFTPFLVLGFIYKSNHNISFIKMIGTSIPKASSFFPLVFIGLGACMLANFLNAIIAQIAALFGITFWSPEVVAPDGLLPQIVFVIVMTVMPALIEEFAFRGVLMSRLRKYGDGFAIFISALMFGVMHGNLVQAPFAFILGLVFGYFYILTGSIWVGVAVHFLNNLFPSLILILQNQVEMEIIYLINTGVIAMLILLSLISLYIYVNSHPSAFKLNKNSQVLAFKDRILAAMPGIILAVALIVAMTAALLYGLMER